MPCSAKHDEIKAFKVTFGFSSFDDEQCISLKFNASLSVIITTEIKLRAT